MLGRGYALGKRYRYDSSLNYRDTGRRTFWPVLEKEPSLVKHDPERDLSEEVESEQKDKHKQVNPDKMTESFQSNEQIKDLPEESKRIFGFGHRLGNGFALGKRSKRSLADYNIDGYVREPSDYMSIYEDNGHNLDDPNDKRYFDSDMGGRFGKRSNDPYLDEFSEPNRMQILEAANKRYFHSDPGYRFKFGKRSAWKRYLGHVLGSGFRLGKRSRDENGIMDSMDNEYEKRFYGNLLSRGYKFGKRGMDYLSQDDDGELYFIPPEGEESFDLPYYGAGPEMEKRYGHILGRGFRFGRPNKRYGWILGNGYRLGKRAGGRSDLNLEDSLTQVFKSLDKYEDIDKTVGDNFDESDKSANDFYNAPYKRYVPYNHSKRIPFGHVLGNGFAFGKRNFNNAVTSYESNGDNNGMVGAEKRAPFGHWLGHGFKMGKRSDEYPDNEYYMHNQ